MKKRIGFVIVAGCAVLISLPSFLSSKESNEVPFIDTMNTEPSNASEDSRSHSTPKFQSPKQNEPDASVKDDDKEAKNTNDTSSYSIKQKQETTEPFGFSGSGETLVIKTDDPTQLKDKNRKPEVNLATQQSIQNEVNQWVFTESSPVNYSLDISGLFEDPDGDLLTTQMTINHPSFSVSGSSGNLQIQGTPKAGNTPTQIIIRAKDSHHGLEEDAWVSATFQLPFVDSGLEEDTSHPLIGQTWFRLETTNNLAGKNYNYEVVYCEAFKFINDEVFFAASKTLTTCPQENDLRLVGNYHVSEGDLIATSSLSPFDSDMTWRILEEYPDSPKYSTAYVASVLTGKHYETYTLGSSRTQIEQRINTVTGQYSLQMTPHDYMYLATNGRYYLGVIGMHLSNYQQSNPSNPDIMDGDLNIQSKQINVTCNDLLTGFNYISVAGKGVYGDIIGQTTGEQNEPIECAEVFVPQWQKRYSFFDVDFLSFDEFKSGEIFSIILRPRAEFAHKVEEIKMNVKYLTP
ncbi:hypothetical protein [Vibrio sp. 99-70-13A1]|uniref:hypothetical protein n=1 Tax=Vibrio sp. 99-70-13A1 TaxID=2607601 RepID=UPI0014933D30|nr:hypothetical protein [Vibrio sp. 99-70-13A1]NOH96208.1 hypothetical protein [Vibrio sp. 99-70-13A1]